MFIVELCASNDMMTKVTEMEAAAMDVVSYSCLDRCAECLLGPYVYANGSIVEGTTCEDVLSALRRRKEEEDAEMESWL